MSKHELWELQNMQCLPLNLKVRLTEQRIREWVNEFGEDGVVVSFSGGKDSTVLLHIVRKMYPNVKAMFLDTGIEYPEVRNFVKKHENVVIFYPKMNIKNVIRVYGYPFFSKEISECVYGARKYLTQIMNNETILDRQTDRQTDRPYKYRLDRITGTGAYQRQTEYQKLCQVGGGYDNKYRKLRGISEYSKQKNEKQGRRQQSETCNNARNVNEIQRGSCAGEYP